jgi:predicted ATPase
MLKRFRVNNFRNLLNIEFNPVGVNLLMGRNNAGKTNLCCAIRFLGLTSSCPLETALRNTLGETWNVSNAYVSETTITMEADCSLPDDSGPLDFHYEIQIRSRAGTGSLQIPLPSLEVVKELLTLQQAGAEPIKLISSENGRVTLRHDGRAGRGEIHPYVDTHAPTDATMLFVLYDLEVNQRVNLFKRYLQSWGYYSFNPQSLRSPAVELESARLLSDGRNLSRTLYTLHNENPFLEEEIIKAVQDIEPKLEYMTFVTSPDPDFIYFSFQDRERKRFSAQSISDGTLRFLAMTYLIFSAGSVVETGVPPPLILIEEPENGLYVGHLKPLLERIDLAGKAGQFIFTTHNPYFIDLFDTNLDGLHLLKVGKPSCSLTKPDPERIRKFLAQMPLGEMHFREMLG